MNKAFDILSNQKSLLEHENNNLAAVEVEPQNRYFNTLTY
jgi:hypothetical protein